MCDVIEGKSEFKNIFTGVNTIKVCIFLNKLFVCSGGEYLTGIIVYFFNLSESICMSSIINIFIYLVFLKF